MGLLFIMLFTNIWINNPKEVTLYMLRLHTKNAYSFVSLNISCLNRIGRIDMDICEVMLNIEGFFGMMSSR